MKMGAFLAELHRGVMDKRHSLDRPETIIGRDTAAHIHVDDASVSRQHAVVKKEGDRYVIHDLGSRNGTNVNEHHLKNRASRELKVNDCIFLGKTVLCFVIAEDKMAKVPTVLLDRLTGLANREGFFKHLNEEMRSTRSQHRPLGLAMVGIDDLAGINERFGQEGGDAALKHVADILTNTRDPGEIIARYRGAVFGVIAPDLLDGLLLERAERLRSSVEVQPLSYDNDLILVTVSVGITPMMALDKDSLVAAADAALSKAKQRGNCVERVSRAPDAETERYQRRMVPKQHFAQWLKGPVSAFVVRWVAPISAASNRQTPLDFELQAAVQQNLSGEELATYPDCGGCVVVTVPRADETRIPRLCEAIRATFEKALTARKLEQVPLEFARPRRVDSAESALELADQTLS